MNDREGALVGAVLVLALVLALGFVVHRSPRFAGSLAGGVLGVAAALAMLAPAAYSLLKRVRRVRAALAARLPLGRALAWHGYAGVTGAVLAILHSGHRFESPLGVALVATMLTSVASGFAGRHVLRFVGREMGERQQQLQRLRHEYAALAPRAAALAAARAHASGWWALRRTLGHALAGDPPPERAEHAALEELAGGIAELEYSIAADERLRRALAVWLAVHLAASLAFYALLALHVASGITYGLRWWT